MDQMKDYNQVLEVIKSEMGSAFEYDDVALSQAYSKSSENPSSLTIKILSIFGGFLSTITFLIFIAITGLYDSEYALIVLGFIFITCSIILNKRFDLLVIESFSITLYIVGFLLVMFALSSFKIDDNIIAISSAVLALICLCVTRNYLLVFISVLIIMVSILFLIINMEVYEMLHVYVGGLTILLTYIYLNEGRIITTFKQISKLYNPIRISLVFALLMGLMALTKSEVIPYSVNLVWLSSLIIGGAVLFATKSVLNINNIQNNQDRLKAYGFVVLLLVPTVFAPSIAGAILILLLSFFVNHKTGMAIGIIAIIYFISQYYYDMSVTLLTKSIILFISGLIFIIIYFLAPQKKDYDGKI